MNKSFSDGESTAYIAGPDDEWHEIGYATVEILPDLSYPDALPALDDGESWQWPPSGLRQSLTAVLSQEAQQTYRNLLDELGRCQRARVRRVAHDLRLPLEEASRSFDAVQRVLEAAGVGDGYGQLTVPQPVRLPITWEGL